MGKAHPSSHARSYHPKHYVSLTDYPTETVEVNPIYEYFLLFYRRINMAVLNFFGIKSSHIPFTFATGNLIDV